MTERQYRQTLKNGALRSERLFESATCASFLRTTARSVRLRQAAQEAWQTVADDEWLPVSSVAAIVDGVATVECGDAVTREQIRWRAGALLRQMKSKIRGLQGLRIAAPREAGRSDVGE